MSWIGSSLGLSVCEDTATAEPSMFNDKPLSAAPSSFEFDEQLAALLQTSSGLQPFRPNNPQPDSWSMQPASPASHEHHPSPANGSTRDPLSHSEPDASLSLRSSSFDPNMQQPTFLFPGFGSNQQQGRSSSTEGIAELQRRVAYLQREADMLRAEQAVLRAENEALAADKAVVQSENGLLRDRMRIMETSPFIPLFEPVIREAPDSDPIHVMAARGHCEENCSRPCCQFPISPDGTLNGAARLHLTVRSSDGVGSILTLSAGECARMPETSLASLWKLPASLPPFLQGGSQALTDISSLWPRTIVQTRNQLCARSRQEYVNACAACLPDIEESAAARGRLQRLIIEIGLLMGCKAFGLPKSLRTFHATKMEDSPFAPASPSEVMSPDFVDSLKFSQNQLQKLAEIHAIWHQELCKLREERNSICTSIQAIPLGAKGSGAQAGAYLRLQDGISALKESLRKDHVLHIRMFHLTWKSCFTAEQCGKILVQSYPWCPDAAAICATVAAQYEHPIDELPAGL